SVAGSAGRGCETAGFFAGNGGVARSWGDSFCVNVRASGCASMREAGCTVSDGAWWAWGRALAGAGADVGAGEAVVRRGGTDGEAVSRARGSIGRIFG